MDTKSIKVGTHEIVLRTFLTGRQNRELLATVPSTAQINADGSMTNIDASTLNAMQDTMAKLVIVSIDGNTENIIDTILDLPSVETNEIMAAVTEITQAKKNS